MSTVVVIVCKKTKIQTRQGSLLKAVKVNEFFPRFRTGVGLYVLCQILAFLKYQRFQASSKLYHHNEKLSQIPFHVKASLTDISIDFITY